MFNLLCKCQREFQFEICVILTILARFPMTKGHVLEYVEKRLKITVANINSP